MTEEDSMREAKIGVLIVDDHMLTRLGLRILIERCDDLQVVGEANNGQEALSMAQQLAPDVVVMDVNMPVMHGIEATKELKSTLPEIAVLILTTHDHDDDVFAALSAGADGYCLKDVSAHRLCSAIRAVYQKASWLDPAIAQRILKASAVNHFAGTQDTAMAGEQPPSPTASSAAPASSADSVRASSMTPKVSKSPKANGSSSDCFSLSPRENEILGLLVEGLSNQDMATRLHVSGQTIKTHMRHIMEKLAVSGRTQVAVKAIREGIVRAPQQS